MFRKLMKYEWTAMMRTMIPIYLAVIAVTVFNTLMFHTILNAEIPFLEALPFWGLVPVLSGSLYVIVMVILVVFTLMMTIQRFYKGLLKEEGYLMFTLPVAPWQLALSKALTAGIVELISVFVAFLSIGICIGNFQFLTDLASLVGELFEAMILAYTKEPAAATHLVLFGMEAGAAILVGVIGAIYQLYLSMSIGHLAGNHKVAFSVLAFVVLNIVINMVELMAAQSGFQLISGIYRPDIVSTFHIVGVSVLAFSILEAVLMAAGTHWILNKKLNLE